MDTSVSERSSIFYIYLTVHTTPRPGTGSIPINSAIHKVARLPAADRIALQRLFLLAAPFTSDGDFFHSAGIVPVKAGKRLCRPGSRTVCMSHTRQDRQMQHVTDTVKTRVMTQCHDKK